MLEILQSDFLPICEGMATGTLGDCEVAFRPEATVCKYVVPEGYGVQPRRDCRLVIDEEQLAASGASLFYAAVNQPPGGTLPGEIAAAVDILRAATALLDRNWAAGQPVRLLGIGVSRLGTRAQTRLGEF